MAITLKEYLNKENAIQGLDDILVDDVPLWRIVRNEFRNSYIGVKTKTAPCKLNFLRTIFNHLLSFIGLSKLLINKRKIDNVFFPHPRLFLVKNMYMDRLTDPLIDYSNIKDNYIILERHQNGEHRRPRYHSEKVVYMDMVDSLCLLGAFFFQIYYKKKYCDEVENLLFKLNSVLQIDKREYRLIIYKCLTRFFLMRTLTIPILKSLSPKRIFLTPRITFNHIISYSKQAGITTIELQHGITVGDTILYSGKYNSLIDPDYFFVFGKDNISRYYSMPLDRIKNIGFPYKNFIKNIGLKLFDKNVVLVISEPTISERIVNVVDVLAEKYSSCEFHIRCHPQESLTSEMLDRIDMMPNVKVVSNTLESFCALSQYTNVVGENSSVLYEAMSLRKKVARLNLLGLHIKESALIHGGTIINTVEDFGRFLHEPYSNVRDTKELYSDFQPEIFESIL